MSYQEISNNIEQWKKMNPKEIKTTEYYYKEIFPAVIHCFVKNSQKQIENKRYDQVISVLGFSPEPAILIHHLIQPNYHFFICTQESQKSLDFITNNLHLLPTNSGHVVIDPSSCLDIYAIIRSRYFNNRELKTLIDITGGKKSMGAIASLAGHFLDMDIAYVDYGCYDELLRKPEPCSEYLLFLENPYVELGDLKLDKAIDFFNSYQFDAAIKLISKDKEIVRNKSIHELLFKLCEIYNYWDQFNFSQANKKLEALLNPSSRADSLNKSPLKDHLKKNSEALQSLLNSDSGTIDWLVNFYVSAKRMEENGRYDMGVLLLYRTLEGIEQLSLQEYDIHTSDDISMEKYYQKGITLESYHQHCKTLYNNYQIEDCIPNKISLMTGYILLKMKNAKLMQNVDIKKIQQQTSLRNNSIFAHGKTPLQKNDYLAIERIVVSLLKQYFEIKYTESFAKNSIEACFENVRNNFSFPKLDYNSLRELIKIDIKYL